MAQTVSNLADVMKEVFTQDRLEKQFLDPDSILSRFEATSRFTIGKKAVVPVHKGRSGGVSVKSSAGGALNAADEQKVDRAEYTVPYHYGQIEIEMAAINEATGGGFSVGSAIELEVSGIVSDVRNQLTREVLGNGDALIAQCTTSTNTNTINLLATDYGFDAIERGWLYPGLQVDIGTTASEAAVGDGVEITAVSESETTPTITVSGSATTTSSSHYVSLKDARSGTTAYESTGLRTVAGSNTSAVGGLDPDTAGEEFWKPAYVDTATTVLSLDLLLLLQRKITQKGGSPQTYAALSLKQQANLYSLLQNQVRFTSDKSEAGNVDQVKWNSMTVEGFPEVPNREVYMLTIADYALVTGSKIKKPTFVSDLQGANQGMIWKQGYTSFVDAVAYPIGLAVKRRNRSAAAIGLTA